MSHVVMAHERGIDGTVQTQHLLHRLGGTVHVGVGLADSVQKDVVALQRHKWFKCSRGGSGAQRICDCPENTAHLDHVELVVVEENGVHFAVQLFESALDGAGGQRAIGAILEEEMVA